MSVVSDTYNSKSSAGNKITSGLHGIIPEICTKIVYENVVIRGRMKIFMKEYGYSL